MQKKLIVVGGGLAGSEAAWQAAQRGISVTLYEMRPTQTTAAHQTGLLAELVCSNSFGSLDPISAPGLLKDEMRRLGSLILSAGEAASLPAGGALGIDRDIFSRDIHDKIFSHPNITILHEEVKNVPRDSIAIIATGPLTSDPLAHSIREITHAEHLSFFDAVSPIVDAESINMETVFRASRYRDGEGDYLNCPFDSAQYDLFYDAMVKAEVVPFKPFEKISYFENCLPIEVLAERGKQTPLFGPMKPVGLMNPKTQRQPFAVVQLRAENRFGTCYNMVGFQTKMKWPEQKRIFRMIPGLEQAEFLRLGSIHRNTFINAPRLLLNTLQLRSCSTLLMAGQLTGVEGYVESAAIGYLAGLNATRLLNGTAPVVPPVTTAHGALIQYITESDARHFQPMNINFGLFPPLSTPEKNRVERNRKIVERGQKDLSEWISHYSLAINFGQGRPDQTEHPNVNPETATY